MGYSRFRNLKIRRANKSADNTCLETVERLQEAVDELLAAVVRYEDLGKKEQRAADQVHMAERDKNFRVADFRKRLAESEMTVVQRTLGKYGRSAMDAEEYLELEKNLMPEEEEKRDERLAADEAERAAAQSMRVRLAAADTDARFKELEAQRAQLTAEIALLTDTAASLRTEIASQQKLTKTVALEAITSYAKRRKTAERKLLESGKYVVA